MKKLIPILAGLLVAGCAMAGPLQFTDATIQTNGASLATQTPDGDGLVSGWIDAVMFDITAGTTHTNSIVLSTQAGNGTGAARTLLTLTSMTTDKVYPVRDLVTGVTGSDISNEPARHALQGDRLRLTATNNGDDTNTTAVTMTVYVILTDSP